MMSKHADGGRVIRLGAGAGFSRDRIEPGQPVRGGVTLQESREDRVRAVLLV